MASRHAAGYVRIFRPGHPLAARDGYVLEHRLVAYEAGMEIPPGHHVHHINGVKDDNRIENLEVVEEAAHHRQHIREAGQVVNQFGAWPLVSLRLCERCGTPFKPWTSAGRFCSRVCANRRAVAA